MVCFRTQHCRLRLLFRFKFVYFVCFLFVFVSLHVEKKIMYNDYLSMYCFMFVGGSCVLYMIWNAIVFLNVIRCVGDV